MENLEGRSLDVIMRDPDMSFTEEDIWRLALHMLSVLEDLHRQNIIHRDVGTHRDVKPSNIVLCGADYKLVDLGTGEVIAACEEDVNQSLVTHDTVLNVAGTHGFMPPEAYRDPENVGP
jgi:serine/threonine protein kinase